MPRPSSRPPRDELVDALRTHRTVEATAEALGGVHRTTVQRWIRELGIRLEWIAEEDATSAR